MDERTRSRGSVGFALLACGLLSGCGDAATSPDATVDAAVDAALPVDTQPDRMHMPVGVAHNIFNAAVTQRGGARHARSQRAA